MLLGYLRRIFTGTPRQTLQSADLAMVEALVAAGALDEAEAALAVVQRAIPQDPAVYLWQARLLARRGRHGEAASAYDQACALRPGWTDALLEQAVAYKEIGRYEDAIACLDEVIVRHPEERVAHTNRGLALRELGRYAEAEACLRRAVDLSPLNPDTWAHLGLVLIEQGKIDEAIGLLQGILEQMPEHAEAHWNLALAYLRRGDFASGWPHYEYRLRRADAPARSHDFPEWQGHAVENGALLIMSEQGPGDEIMFASCFPDVIARVSPVVIECDPRLAPLFARSFPGAVVAGKSVNPPRSNLRIAAQIHAGSLPRFFRAGWESFPRHSGYLVPDADKANCWRTRLARLGPGRRIGLSWRGGSVGTRQRLRSMSLEALLPILRTPGAQFVSLQYGPSEEEITRLRERHDLVLHSFPEANQDFDELAALVSCLDLVVSVQTAAVHLTGALGKPCWVMVPAVAEWRYLSSGDRMPWYPSVRLFRQAELGEWGPVIERVAGELLESCA